jgi:hypothetical protein
MTSIGALIAALKAREVEKVSQGCPFNRKVSQGCPFNRTVFTNSN